MTRRLLRLAGLLLIVARVAAAAPQTIAIPAYFYPSYPDPVWAQMQSAVPTVGFAVMNPASGPGAAPDPNYVSQVAAARAAGVRILGYVATSYAAKSAAAVKAEIDDYYAWYPVDGIFFDEANNECATAHDYYDDLDTYVKAQGGLAMTVINPGTNTPACFLDTADVILNFEGSYAQYQAFTPDGWEAGNESHVWHLIYDTPEGQMPAAILQSQARGAGYVYVTADGLANPWDTLPAPSYWAAELAYVRPAASCAAAVVKPKLVVKRLDSAPGDESITFNGDVTVPGAPTIDPFATGVRVLLADTGGVALDANLPGGAFADPPGYGWKVNAAHTSWKWADKNAVPLGGVTRLAIKDLSASTPGRFKFKLRGRDATAPVSAARLPLTATLYFDGTVVGTPCALATFPGPSPSCVANAIGSAITCR